MKLKTYLKQAGISNRQFGERIGASEFGVRKWAYGERIPRPVTMRKIEEATGGAVGPRDFFNSEPIQEDTSLIEVEASSSHLGDEAA